MDIPSFAAAQHAATATTADCPSVLALPPVPPLPAAAALDPAFAASAALGTGVAAWLDTYIAHSTTLCPMLPPSFHESAALWLASVAVARRLYVSLPAGPVYPSLFVAWLAPNAVYETGPAYDLVRDLAERAFPGLLAPSQMAPSHLLYLLAGTIGPDASDWAHSQYGYADSGQDTRFATQRGWLPGDLACLLPASRRAFRGGGLDLLLAFYACHPRYRYAARRAGFLTVPNSYLSLLGFATPAALGASLTDRSLWDLGWWSSFAFIAPDFDRRDWREPTLAAEPPVLLETLVRLFRSLPGTGEAKHYRPCAVPLVPAAHEAWSRYRRALVWDLRTPELDVRLWSAYCHLPLQLIKVATLLAALDWVADLPPDPPALPRPAAMPRGRAKTPARPAPQAEPFRGPAITLAHLARAQSIVESWRSGLHRCLVAEGVAASADMGARILRQVERHGPTGVTARDICRSMVDRRPGEIAEHLAHLLGLGLVETVPAPSQPGPGRPTTYYRLPR